MAKGTKTPPNTNNERYIIKNVVEVLITRLNNILTANDQTHRYHLDWIKGTGYVQNDFERTNNYYKLDLYIVESDQSIIPLYGANYPVPAGQSQLRILEAELQAYKDFLLHGVGSLISVQHSSFLQAEAAELNRQKEEESENKSNLIL